MLSVVVQGLMTLNPMNIQAKMVATVQYKNIKDDDTYYMLITGII